MKTVISTVCCLLLVVTPLAASELRHEAFLRGGKAIAVALNEPAPKATPAVPAAVPPARALPQERRSGMSKGLWGVLIGGFAVAGGIVYWAATGPGASVRNCSTCRK